MQRRHCDKCDKVLDRDTTNTQMVRAGEICVGVNIERYQGGWVPTVDYCRGCLSALVFEYYQWLKGKA